MIPMLGPMMGELKHEAATTKRVLDRVPADKLTWKPHPHSMSLGQLAMHIAMIPGSIAQLAQLETFDVANANFVPPQPNSAEEIRSAFDAGINAAQAYIGGLDETAAMANWRMTANGKELFTMPRVGLLRAIMLNHWYHHRGQLSVYLRLLDVPVPAIYGNSYDENPLA